MDAVAFQKVQSLPSTAALTADMKFKLIPRKTGGQNISGSSLIIYNKKFIHKITPNNVGLFRRL